MDQDALTVVVSGPLSHVGQVREGLSRAGLRVDARSDSRGFDTDPTMGWVTAHRTITVLEWHDPDIDRDQADLARVGEVVTPLGWAIRMHWNPTEPGPRLVVVGADALEELHARIEAIAKGAP